MPRYLPLHVLLAACLVGALAPVVQAQAPPPATPARALSLTTSDVFVARSGESVRAKVKVTNVGRLAARKVVVRVKAGPGAKVRTSRVLLPSALTAGQSRTVSFGVRLTRQSGAKLSVSARAERTKAATGSFAIKVGTGLEGRTFQQFRNTGVAVSVVETITFIDGTHAFVGLPEEPPTCRPVVEGCKPYTFTPATGSLTIGGVPAKLTRSQTGFVSIAMAETAYNEMYIPPPGARVTIAATNYNSTGTCIGGSTCSQFTRRLDLRPDGTFTFLYSASVEGETPGPESATGTYEFTGRGIRLTYANGTVLNRSFGIIIFTGTEPDYDWALMGSTLFINVD